MPSTRRYIRRRQKQEIAKKELKKNQASKVDIVSFISQKKNVSLAAGRLEAGVFNEEIGPIDSESVQLLEKLVHFVDKD